MYMLVLKTAFYLENKDSNVRPKFLKVGNNSWESMLIMLEVLNRIKTKYGWNGFKKYRLVMKHYKEYKWVRFVRRKPLFF